MSYMDAKLAILIDHVPYVLATKKKGQHQSIANRSVPSLMRCICYLSETESKAQRLGCHRAIAPSLALVFPKSVAPSVSK
jgi:hypothetical protein